MQQRIIVKVPMKKEKDRSTAMKVAAGTSGVRSVKIGGEERDKVIVIGDDVDAVKMTQSLINKFGAGASLVMVEPLRIDSRRFHQPLSYYNNPPPPPPPPPPYSYSYDQPAYDSCCSII